MKTVSKLAIYSSRPVGIQLTVEINQELLEGLPEDLVRKIMGEAIRHLEAFSVGRERDSSNLDYKVESE